METPPPPPLPQTYLARPIQAVELTPRMSLSPSQALADILLMLGAMFGFLAFTVVTGMTDEIQRWFPRGGHFVWVVLNGLFCMSTVVFLLACRRLGPGSIGLGPQRPTRVLVIGIIAVPVCFLAGALTNVSFVLLSGNDVDAFLQERGEFLGAIGDIPLAWILPLSLFVGLYEEILFRGMILSRLQAATRSNIMAILLSSILFGAMHFSQGPAGMAQTAVVGLVLATVVVRSRSIWPAIFAHAAIDTLSLLISALILPQLQEYLDYAAGAA